MEGFVHGGLLMTDIRMTVTAALHTVKLPSVSQARGRRSNPRGGGVISDRHDAESAAVRPGSMRLRPSARYHDVSRLPIDRRRGRSNWLAASLAGRTRR
jgi:hypothetical protein